jgi:hypothetical protein
MCPTVDLSAFKESTACRRVLTFGVMARKPGSSVSSRSWATHSTPTAHSFCLNRRFKKNYEVSYLLVKKVQKNKTKKIFLVQNLSSEISLVVKMSGRVSVAVALLLCAVTCGAWPLFTLTDEQGFAKGAVCLDG